MSLQVKSVQNKFKVLDERGKRSGFLLFLHCLKRVRNEPFFNFIIGYTFEDK